ncbi:hypothetical protein LDENG_00096590 [Lucifuga dentata]|nr:hypothetical protein LDENG_00096590 [Lucifuga dentata]
MMQDRQLYDSFKLKRRQILKRRTRVCYSRGRRRQELQSQMAVAVQDPYSTDPALREKIDDLIHAHRAKKGPEACQNKDANIKASECSYKQQKRFFSKFRFKRKLVNGMDRTDALQKSEEPRPPASLPAPPPPQPRHEESPPTSGSQRRGGVEDVRRKQQRPSVLRQLPQTASTQLSDKGASPNMQSRHFLLLRRDGSKQNAIKSSLHDGTLEGSSALFESGLCRWPGCGAASEDFPAFLKHLHSEHGRGDRSLAQWKVQQDMVQYMERQLIVEKQKLFAMQLHLHLSEHKHVDMQSLQKAASAWSYSLPLAPPQAADGVGGQQWGIKHVEELVQHSYQAAARAHHLPDFLPSIECYKYSNIRPPYTYAYLIRWAILESADKQLSLSEIYSWFTTMFYYFRHNTATWKNAVRHNLSLHKCFVRMEGGRGAVWTVDETEYQRRKGQKYHRDCPVKWVTSYPHFCPEES